MGSTSTSRRQRVAIAGMWQETNTYSPRPTALADFEAFALMSGAPVLDRHRGTGSVAGGFLDGVGRLEGAEPLGVFFAGAWPSGPPAQAVADELLARLEAALAAAPDVDGVLVDLHGAMVADGHPDMELETLVRVRARYGEVPLVAVLDLHGNPSPEAVAACDALVGYRTYPHEDMRDCGEEAAALLGRMLAGERLVTVLGKLPALTSPVAQATAAEPMRGLLARAEERAAAAGVARISLLPGFPYSDVARAGFSVTAVAPADREQEARAVVAATLGDVEAHLSAFGTSHPGPAEAVEQALALPPEQRPVVLADLADNVGGGGPGDGTALLAELVARSAGGAVVPLADAAAVAAAHDAGPGATLELALGARSDALHGSPVAVRARVVSVGDGDYVARGSYMTGQRFSMGRTAVLEVEQADRAAPPAAAPPAGATGPGVRVLAMERATPPFHVEQLTANGIDPAGATLIALKGAVAWQAPYRDVARAAIAVDTPGCCPADPLRLPRRTAPQAVDPLDFRA